MPSNHTTIGAWVNSKLSGICCVLHINESGLIPISNILYVVANPVHGLLGRTRSEEHLQKSYKESMKSKTKQKTSEL